MKHFVVLLYSSHFKITKAFSLCRVFRYQLHAYKTEDVIKRVFGMGPESYLD